MKIKHIGNPSIGPRGGLAMRGSVTLRNGGSAIWIHFDSPTKWGKEQDEAFREVVELLKSKFEKTEDFKESGR